jgi:hypothetical protein
MDKHRDGASVASPRFDERDVVQRFGVPRSNEDTEQGQGFARNVTRALEFAIVSSLAYSVTFAWCLVECIGDKMEGRVATRSRGAPRHVPGTTLGIIRRAPLEVRKRLARFTHRPTGGHVDREDSI